MQTLYAGSPCAAGALNEGRQASRQCPSHTGANLTHDQRQRTSPDGQIHLMQHHTILVICNRLQQSLPAVGLLLLLGCARQHPAAPQAGVPGESGP